MSSYSKRFISQAQIESDQKDIIIAQLKAEIFEARKNEEDYYTLSDELKKLEQKYRIAQEEKLITDDEFRNRHENNLRNIQSFKSDCENFTLDIKDRNREIQELNSENFTMKQLCDQRASEIAKLKQKIEYEFGRQEQFYQEQVHLKQQDEILKKDRRHLLVQLDDLKQNIQELTKKQEFLDRNYEDLESQAVKLQRQCQAQDKENVMTDEQIIKKDEDIQILVKKNNDLRKQIKQNKLDLDNTECLNSKHTNEAKHYNNLFQNEASRNQELQERISNLETLLRQKERYIQDIKKDIDEVHKDNQDRQTQLSAQDTDITACQRHKESLKVANEEILLTLHRYCDQDDQVREILNRRSKLTAANTAHINSNLNNQSLLNGTHHSAFKRSPSKSYQMVQSRRLSPNKFAQSFYNN